MKERARKVAAVICSVILVAGYVGYRGWGQSMRVMPGSKSSRVFQGSQADETVGPATATTQGTVVLTTQPAQLFLFSGSKSGAIARPSDLSAIPGATTTSSGTITLFVPASTQPAVQPGR